MNTMKNIANIRQHWPDRMTPNFGGLSRGPPNSMQPPVPGFNNGAGGPGSKLALGPHPSHPGAAAAAISASLQNPAPDAYIHYSFNLPFASDLLGPDTEDIIHATTDAVMRWTHPAEAADDVPVYELPVHAENLANLRKLCREMSEGPLPIQTNVISTTPQNAKGQVVTVCLSGAAAVVFKAREQIMNETPISLRCTTIDIEGDMVADIKAGSLKQTVTDFLDSTSAYTGVDMFLLGPKLMPPVMDGINGDAELRGRDDRWRVAIYGDILSSEHAKTTILVHIDQLLGRIVDAMHIDFTLQQIICGRKRKNIKLIESATGTAIYFPPPFSAIFRPCPESVKPRDPAEIFITGENPQSIQLAKLKLHEMLRHIRLVVRDVAVPAEKIDSILLTRLDKVRKIIEANGTFIVFPPLGSRNASVRIQASENLHAERTARELMNLAGQFYSGFWIIAQPDSRQLPQEEDIRTMLCDICANSDADISCQGFAFTITGSDDAVKDALMVLSKVPFVVQSQYQIEIKIELANEHKEFVSGKKNGKINKIMGQSNVQIMFEQFGEYNFNIDVTAQSYDAMKNGLGLVEQEMPASISFHVPDQYHKRIIGIGGQHIQRIMKKHSVFVKFSNAQERSKRDGLVREEEDNRVDNVICRTPARNAQNLELVKSEILEMVDRADSEFTTQTENVDRLYHRQLLARLPEIEMLEKKWNCKIIFPSTEQASDEVTFTGPQWQVPLCVDEFLGMVPDNHELVFAKTPELMKFLDSPEFLNEINPKFKSNYIIEVTVQAKPEELTEDGKPTVSLLWTFTRNNAGGLRDAMDFLQGHLTTAGVETTIVKGSMPRPKSDTFEESLPFFNSKLLQQASTAGANAGSTDSPTKAGFGEDAPPVRSTIFDKLRKPGSMSSISSFLDRRKNSSHSASNSFFKGSSNVSKSSLISIESTRSFNADRNPWNDSGVNLTEDEHIPWPSGVTGGLTGRHYANTSGSDHKLAMTPMSAQYSNGHHHNGHSPHNGGVFGHAAGIPGLGNANHNHGHTNSSNGYLASPGDLTPRHGTRQSADSRRPSTSHSTDSGYPGPNNHMGPLR